MLGALLGLTDIVKSESIMKVLESRIPSGFLEMNRKALDLGIALGSKIKK
jgi:2-oxoglutarate ferredoxin oxidoreductase subunit gamma